MSRHLNEDYTREYNAAFDAAQAEEDVDAVRATAGVQVGPRAGYDDVDGAWDRDRARSGGGDWGGVGGASLPATIPLWANVEDAGEAHSENLAPAGSPPGLEPGPRLAERLFPSPSPVRCGLPPRQLTPPSSAVSAASDLDYLFSEAHSTRRGSERAAIHPIDAIHYPPTFANDASVLNRPNASNVAAAAAAPVSGSSFLSPERRWITLNPQPSIEDNQS